MALTSTFLSRRPPGGVQEQRRAAGALAAGQAGQPQDEGARHGGVQVRERGHAGPHHFRDARVLHRAQQVERQEDGLHLLRLPHHRAQRPAALQPRQAQAAAAQGRQAAADAQGGLLRHRDAGRTPLPPAGHGLRHHQGQGGEQEGERRRVVPCGLSARRQIRYEGIFNCCFFLMRKVNSYIYIEMGLPFTVHINVVQIQH